MDSQPTAPPEGDLQPEPSPAPAPAPAAAIGPETPAAALPPPAAFAQRPKDYWALWAVALVSLALNAFFLYEQWALLAYAREQAPAVAAAAAEVRAWRAGAFEYTVQVDRTVPVITNVPINQTVSVPISATLPINTEVAIPISFAGFTQVLRVPVQAVIPVRLETEIPINLTIPIHADVPVKFDVPIRIAVAGSALDPALARAETALTQLSAQLRDAEPANLMQRLFGGAP